jgi:hypothetical protein
MAKFDFNFMYKVDLTGSTYSIDSFLTSDVKVKDTKDGPHSGDDRHFLGDIPNDGFHVTHAGQGLNGTYHFVSVADVGGVTGFIGQQGGTYYFFTDQNLSNGTNLHLDSGTFPPVCFMPGTHILTPAGEVLVENLKRGDLVQTVDGGSVAVRWIGRQAMMSLFADEFHLPVRIKAGALGDNVPSRDLLTSPDHALFVDGILVHAGALVNGTSIVRERDVPERFAYYHIEVADHSLILAENTPAETFIDNVDRQRFDNWNEYLELDLENTTMVELPYPRAKAYRQVPRAMRTKLEQRGQLLYGQESVKAA